MKNPPYRYLGAAYRGTAPDGTTYKVRYDTDWQEWQVAAFRNGKFVEGPTYYAGGGETGKDDAISTFNHLVGKKNPMAKRCCTHRGCFKVLARRGRKRRYAFVCRNPDGSATITAPATAAAPAKQVTVPAATIAAAAPKTNPRPIWHKKRRVWYVILPGGRKKVIKTNPPSYHGIIKSLDKAEISVKRAIRHAKDANVGKTDDAYLCEDLDQLDALVGSIDSQLKKLH